MPKAPTIRLRLADETSLDLPENEVVQVVTEGPRETAEEGWVRVSPKDAQPLYGKVARVRAAALSQGQKIATFRGVLTIESARRV